MEEQKPNNKKSGKKKAGKKENQYLHHYSREMLQLLPIAQFDGEVVVVDKAEQVAEAVAWLSRHKFVGVDTEARPSFTKGEHYPTSLVQIATHDRCYLFRLSKIGMPQELADFFANSKVCKVGLAFKEDINGLRRLREFEPVNCVDVQTMANNYGIFDLGLQRMFAICFEKKISKSQQLTNWENVELTPEQARYASTDAWATLLIYEDMIHTKALPKKEVLALQHAEKEAQLAHQLEVMAAREAREQAEAQAQEQTQEHGQSEA